MAFVQIVDMLVMGHYVMLLSYLFVKSNIIRGGKYLIERLHMKVLMRLVLNGCNRIILNSTNE